MPSRRPWAFERGTLWALELDETEPAVPVPSPMRGTVREVLASDDAATIAALAAAMGAPSPRPVRERLASGRRCFMLTVQGTTAAYGWVSQGTERIGELERTMLMLPGEAYIWDCATLPAFRRHGLYVALLRHMVGALRGEGLRRLWIGASLDNTPSIRGFRSAGFRPVITLVYLRVLGLRHIWLAGDRSAPATLVDGARRALIGIHERPASAGAPSGAGSALPARERGARES